jgi:hypothetical protein
MIPQKIQSLSQAVVFYTKKSHRKEKRVVNSKIQRMQKRLAELLSIRDKHLAEAQESITAADQLKKEILFEENNAIAAKLRDAGLPPEEFDAVIAHYLSQRKKDNGDVLQNGTATAPPEGNPPDETEDDKEELTDEIEQ